MLHVFLVGSILYFIYNILQAWYIPLNLRQFSSEQGRLQHMPCPCPCPPPPACLEYIWLYSENYGKKKKRLTLCVDFSWFRNGSCIGNELEYFCGRIGLLQEQLFLRGACKVVQGACYTSRNKFCWIYDNSGPGCPTQYFSLVTAIWLH